MTVRHHEERMSVPTTRNRCRRISAVAEHLDISVSSVRRLIRDGRLEAIRIGSSLRVTDASLNRLINAGRR
jgi:excisionase family DNA binding protein